MGDRGWCQDIQPVSRVLRYRGGSTRRKALSKFHMTVEDYSMHLSYPSSD